MKNNQQNQNLFLLENQLKVKNTEKKFTITFYQQTR